MESKFSEVNNIAQGLNNLNQQLFQDLKDKSYLIGHTFFMTIKKKLLLTNLKLFGIVKYTHNSKNIFLMNRKVKQQ